MKNLKRVSYYEYLRVLATLAVVIIHVAMCLPNNYSIKELGILPSAVMNSTYVLVNWAVPAFLMITGALLLNPDKLVDGSKVKKYIFRMAVILLTFGWGYAVLEVVFKEHKINLMILVNSFINMLEGKSWSHMWYIYTLIGLYLITIPLRYMIKSMSRKEFRNLLFILVFGNYVIPGINLILGTEFETYMQWGHYITYYLLGYYVSTISEEKLNKVPNWAFAATAILVSAGKFALNWFWIVNYESVCPLAQNGRFLILIQVVLIFLTVRVYCTGKNLEVNCALKSISRCSFAIYLIHPVFGNIFYKVLGFTPVSFPVGIGMLIMTVLLFGLSWITSFLLVKIPIVKEFV